MYQIKAYISFSHHIMIVENISVFPENRNLNPFFSLPFFDHQFPDLYQSNSFEILPGVKGKSLSEF